MRASRGGFVLVIVLIVALAGVAAWQLRLLPTPGARSHDDAGPAPIALEGATGGEITDASRLAASGAVEKTAAPLPPRPPIPADMPRASGVVVDRGGKGIAGARVISIPDTVTKSYFPREVEGEGFPGFDAITDAEGAFVVALAKSGMHGLVVTADGYAPASKIDVGPGSQVKVTLERAGALVGTVMNMDAEPVAKATVRTLVMVDALRLERETVTDAAGAYRIEGWGAARQVAASLAQSFAIVEATGYAPLYVEGVSAAEPGADVRRDFVVVRGATVRGRVVEAGSEAPLAGVRVVLWSNEGRMHMGRGRLGQNTAFPMPWGPRALGETVSAVDGGFVFDHVPATGFHHVATSTGGQRGRLVGNVAAWTPGRATQTEEVPVLADGATIELTLKLLAAGAVAGRVVDANGSPVAKVPVYPQLASGSGSTWIPKELYPGFLMPSGEPTDAEGRYRLPAIPIAAGSVGDVVLEARVPRGGPFNHIGRAEPDGTLTVRLTAGATTDAPDLVLKEDPAAGGEDLSAIPVRVEDERGAPIEGATVGWAASNGAQFQRTDVAGRVSFMVGRLRAGQTVPPLQLLARAKGFAPTPFSVPFTQAAPELAIVRLGPAHRLFGVVRQADGTPAVGIYVRVANGAVPAAEAFPETTPDALLGMANPRPGAPPFMHYAFAVTDDGGRFQIEDLPQGPYTVVASGVRRSSAAAPYEAKPLRDVRPGVPTDAGELELRLPIDDSLTPGSIEGTVVDAVTQRVLMRVSVRTDTPMPRIHRIGSALIMGQGGPQITVTSPGRYEGPVVAPGTYALIIDASGYRRARVPGVEVRAGERTIVPRVELQRGLTVKGRASLPAGLDASTLGLVFGSVEDSTLAVSLPLDTAGRYEGAGFTAGRWLLRVGSSSLRPGGEAIWAIDDGGLVTIGEGASTTTRDVVVVPGGRLIVELTDPRLPPGQHDSGEPTPEQSAFGSGTLVRITGPDGSVLVDRKGVTRGSGSWGWLVVKPGRYTVRVTFPDGTTLDPSIDVEAGKEARLPAATK